MGGSPQGRAAGGGIQEATNPGGGSGTVTWSYCDTERPVGTPYSCGMEE